MTNKSTKPKVALITGITGQDTCKKMVAYDLEQAKQHALLKQHGYVVNISSE